MGFRNRLKPYKFYFWMGSGLVIIGYHINRTYKTLTGIVNSNVLKSEYKTVAEYIYIDDPSYEITLKMERDKENKHSLLTVLGLNPIWTSLRYSLVRRLLWLSRHGNKDQCTIALEQLAAFKNKEDWDCVNIAQTLDSNTAVLLARTEGADLRYFLPPPMHVRRAALSSELLSQKFLDLLYEVQKINPHSCVHQFLCKNLVHVQEQVIEEDCYASKPDSVNEHDLCILCLDVLHHHLTQFGKEVYEVDASVITLIKLGLLHRLAELILRNYNDPEIDWAVMRIVTHLSVHSNLLTDFFQSGLIGQMARLMRSNQVRLCSSAAVALSNLSGEHCFKPGIYLLHPLYRTRKTPACDLLLVHGLRGGVFVTWRQRDRHSGDHPIGILEGTVASNDSEPPNEVSKTDFPFMDPELKQVIEDLDEIKEECLLSDYEIILNDLPISAKREDINSNYTTRNKRLSLKTEKDDNSSQTCCWPKDWLPKDCKNLRVIGINYWSTLSEWLEKCPWQTADIESRAAALTPAIVKAGVGKDVPMVWLAHSMGGLIVKQVLVEAARSNNDDYTNLCLNTKSVIFFSTPHKGSTIATMPKAAALILWPSIDVQQLQENSPTLLHLDKEFIKFSDSFNWEIVSFAETKPTLVTAFKVPVEFVKPSSADLGRGVFYELPLDHLYICKPATRQSLLYTTVVDVVHRITKEDEIQLSFSSQLMYLLINWLWWIYDDFFSDATKSV